MQCIHKTYVKQQYQARVCTLRNKIDSRICPTISIVTLLLQIGNHLTAFGEHFFAGDNVANI